MRVSHDTCSLATDWTSKGILNLTYNQSCSSVATAWSASNRVTKYCAYIWREGGYLEYRYLIAETINRSPHSTSINPRSITYMSIAVGSLSYIKVLKSNIFHDIMSGERLVEVRVKGHHFK
jgi:hypothetical protein